jgi:methyl-accepting chemotaxis protein
VPLKLLRECVVRVEESDFSPIDITFNSEIGELATSFNRMQAALRQNFCALSGRQHELEQAVTALQQEREENAKLLAVVGEVMKTQKAMMAATTARHQRREDEYDQQP